MKAKEAKELFEKLKTAHELPNDNSGQYNLGYVDAMNMAINTVKKCYPADVGDCCPACRSTNFSDNSTYENNGIIGPGFASWKTADSRACNDCGCIFKPIKGN